jgi:microcystin-dependent protein
MSLARQLADAVSAGELTATATIKMWGKGTIPDGWLECDGSAVSRTTYADLFAEIGTNFGVGDGSTTFNLPNLQDNVPVGKSGTKALGSTGGNATVSPSVTDNIAVNKTGDASGSLNGAPDSGNLAVSVTGNVSVGNTTLSEAQMPSHNHGIGAQYYNSINVGVNKGWTSSSSTTTGWPNEAAQFKGSSSAHGHSGSHNLSGSMNGAPGLGNLGVTINDNIAVVKSGSVSVGNIDTIQPYQAVIFIIKT